MKWSHLIGSLVGVGAAIMIAVAISDNQEARSQQVHLACYSGQGNLHHALNGDQPLATRREWLAAALKGDQKALAPIGLEYACRLEVRGDELVCPEHGRPDLAKLRPPGLLKYPGPFKLPADLLAR